MEGERLTLMLAAITTQMRHEHIKRTLALSVQSSCRGAVVLCWCCEYSYVRLCAEVFLFVCCFTPYPQYVSYTMAVI